MSVACHHPNNGNDGDHSYDGNRPINGTNDNVPDCLPRIIRLSFFYILRHQ
jgi:hypothetical protein